MNDRLGGIYAFIQHHEQKRFFQVVSKRKQVGERNMVNAVLKPVKEEEIPILVEFEEGHEKNGIRVVADGRKATCFVASPEWRSQKIVILYDDEEDPMMAFTTKYYLFNEPGKMSWGHQGEVMEMFHLE